MLSKPNTVKLPFDYAWAILAILFLGLLVSFGVRASFGAYIAPWEHDFSIDRTVVTSISMLSFAVFAVAQPLAGKLDDYFGGRIVPSASILLVGVSLLLSSQATAFWQILIFYGIGFSLGLAGCSNVTATTIVSRWFLKKKGFALGSAVSGMAVGQLIITPATLFLINQFSWRFALGAISLLILAVVTPLTFIFIRSKPEDAGLRPYGYTKESVSETPAPSQVQTNEQKASLFNIFKVKIFWQLTIPYFICGFTDVGLIQIHLIPFAQGKGFPLSIVALTFSIIAICNIVGSIGTGYMSDHFNRSRQLSLIYITRALMFVFILIIKIPWLLIPFAVIYGTTEMASIAPTNSLTAQLFDRYSIGTIIGFVSVSHQLGGALGSWIPSLLFEITGSYGFIFIFSIILLVVSAVIVLQLPDPRFVARNQKNA